MEWEEFTYACRILKKPTSKFTSWCSTLFTLLSVLEAGSISDTPLIIQISVFCQLHRTVHHLNSACQDWACLSGRADGTRGRCVWEQPDSPQRGRKSKGRKEGGEGTPWHDNRPHQRRVAHAAVPWAKGSRLIAHVLGHLNATAAQSYWWISTLTCLFAQLLLSGDGSPVLFRGNRLTADKLNSIRLITLGTRIDSLGNKAVIPSYSKGEERQALVVGATGVTDGTSTMPQLRQLHWDMGGAITNGNLLVAFGWQALCWLLLLPKTSRSQKQFTSNETCHWTEQPLKLPNPYLQKHSHALLRLLLTRVNLGRMELCHDYSKGLLQSTDFFGDKNISHLRARKLQKFINQELD